MKLAGLIVVDLVLGGATIFGVLAVTASDHPTQQQGAIAWTLIALLVILAVALTAMIGAGASSCPPRLKAD
jgi:hypothetical protein